MNRRTFLMLSTSAALSARSEMLGQAGAARLRVGIASGPGKSPAHLRTLASLPELEIAAMSGDWESLAAAREVVQELIGITPPVYRNVAAMTRQHTLELLMATHESDAILDASQHLLLDMPVDPLVCSAHSRPGRCVQILPRNEFIGSPRYGDALSSGGKYTKALIRHRTSLPRPKVASREDMLRWIRSEIGESVDFAAEALDTREFTEVEAIAAPGGAAGAVVFALRLRNREQSQPSLEIAIQARAEDPAIPPATDILLYRSSVCLSFRAAPRSGRLTRLLVRNALDAINTRTPSKLLYSPDSLLAAHRTISSALDTLFVRIPSA